ncbi:hypothetical protein TIFTF001_040118 [Ficus carica]|uniref:Uncharacterized protein n=1 Tax=Ficus carica TaxID=3494 RepID=A0AA87YSE4_FICCA|nr:hypothetical protein TIFTF001_040118 [Ficus carica]
MFASRMRFRRNLGHDFLVKRLDLTSRSHVVGGVILHCRWGEGAWFCRGITAPEKYDFDAAAWT